jgi:alkylated DNA repair dioxygenase AlkB
VADLAIDRKAPVRRIPLGADSWVDVVEGFVGDPDGAFAELRETVPWQQTEVLRYDRYVPERRLGAGLRADDRPLLRQTGLHLDARYRVPFTGVGALLYRTGDDFQGLHSDREMRWLDDTRIAIVVLGQRRPFVFRRRAPLSEVVERIPAGADPDDIVLLPGEGDMLVMGGASQRDWLHGVPRADTPNPRISLTWRWTSRRGRPDTNPTFYDGRHYSDRPRQPGSRSRRT